jgi:hypothetical protein
LPPLDSFESVVDNLPRRFPAAFGLPSMTSSSWLPPATQLGDLIPDIGRRLAAKRSARGGGAGAQRPPPPPPPPSEVEKEGARMNSIDKICFSVIDA